MSRNSIVTGGTSGIGRGITERILEHAKAGDRVYVTYGHNREKAEEFRNSLPEEQRDMLVLMQADMSSYEDMMRFAAEVKSVAGEIDLLVNNVGISTYAKFEDYTFEEWSKVVNTNLSVPVFLVKELKESLKEGGSILFTGSYAGQQAYSSSIVYGVTKAAIHFLTKSLVKEFESKGIRVNAIAPGFIETPWHKDRTAESYDRINRKIALHRFGTVDEVADMAYAVLTNGYMNGSIVDIHGGYDYF